VHVINTAVLLHQSSPFPRNYRELCPRARGTTMQLVPIPAVSPWVCSHYRGVTVVTAGLPWSPSPCSSLVHMPAQIIRS